ncbi:hypothetical protein TNCT6_34700 [Streptomyces sp. 6-11-2]|nr:hypothetical protein TNCT6_34700 [Streptomyces sp. 6-11-2]
MSPLDEFAVLAEGAPLVPGPARSAFTYMNQSQYAEHLCLLGLLRPFRRSGPTAALTSWAAGLPAFWLVNYPINWNVDGGVPLQYQVSVPLAVSLVLYIGIGYVKPEDTPERLAVIEKVNTDGDGDLAAAAVPAPAGAGDDVVGKQP